MSDLVTQFMDAVKAGNASEVRALLAQHSVALRDALDAAVPGGVFEETPLIAAVRTKNHEMIDALLDSGADINARSKWWAGGFSVLDTAHQDPKLIEFLIARGADVDACAAARLGMFDRLRSLLTADPSLVHSRGGDGQTPLHFAATLEIARFLVEECGADMHVRDVDHESTPAQYMIRDRTEIARYLARRGCGVDILMAAALGERELVECCLEADPQALRTFVCARDFPMRNPRAGGSIYIWTLGAMKLPHVLAHEFGHPQLYQWLMDRSPAPLRATVACELGERPAVPVEISPEDHVRLVNAGQSNNLEKVRLMLDSGWLVGAADDGATALHWAAFHGNLAMVALLLDRRARVDLVDDRFHTTPLGWAKHGSANSWHRTTGDYPAVIARLQAATGHSS